MWAKGIYFIPWLQDYQGRAWTGNGAPPGNTVPHESKCIFIFLIRRDVSEQSA